MDRIDNDFLLSVRDEAATGEVLRSLVECGCEIDRFEREQPTLHNIFVSIARPNKVEICES